jgi:hypothetical protein
VRHRRSRRRVHGARPHRSWSRALGKPAPRSVDPARPGRETPAHRRGREPDRPLPHPPRHGGSRGPAREHRNRSYARAPGRRGDLRGAPRAGFLPAIVDARKLEDRAERGARARSVELREREPARDADHGRPLGGEVRDRSSRRLARDALAPFHGSTERSDGDQGSHRANGRRAVHHRGPGRRRGLRDGALRGNSIGRREHAQAGDGNARQGRRLACPGGKLPRRSRQAVPGRRADRA